MPPIALPLLVPVALAPAILLNEVLYDPDGADAGLEFVELAATAGGDPAAPLAGWTLETGNGAQPGAWTVAWTGGPGDRLVGGLFVVGEALVEPPPHALADLDLQNGPDACRLRAPDGAVDRLGWGTPLDASFVEGTPAADVAGGRALARLPDGVDSDDNARDFRPAEPTPGAFNAPDVSVEVEAFTFEGGRATWALRNAGRLAWRDEVRLECSVHPGETLAAGAAPAGGGTLAPGERGTVVLHATPPPGLHRPRPHPPPPGGDPAPPPWPGPGDDLLVTEAMSRPATGDPEWVEVLVVGSRPVDLGALRLEDAAGTAAALAGTLAVGARAVLAPDAAALRATWALPPGTLVVEGAPWPSLNHTGPVAEAAETLRLLLADSPPGSAAEPGSEPAPAAAVAALPGGAAEGVAWERIARALPGDAPSTWAPSLDPSGGTPGRPESRDGDRRVPAAGPGRLSVAPAPFVPARDRTVLLVLRTARPVATGRMTVLDTSGRRVAELVPWAAGGAELRALWDGRHASGEPAALGMYLVVAEAAGQPAARAPLVLVR